MDTGGDYPKENKAANRQTKKKKKQVALFASPFQKKNFFGSGGGITTLFIRPRRRSDFFPLSSFAQTRLFRLWVANKVLVCSTRIPRPRPEMLVLP